MPTVMNFDELNVLALSETEKPRSLPIDQYFDEMDLNNRQKKERKSLAEDLMESMMDFLEAAVLMLKRSPDLQIQSTLVPFLIAEFASGFAKHNIPVQFADAYAVRLAQELVKSTFDHLSDEYFLSEDRARFVGEEEANTAYNYRDFWKAVSDGKKRKRWKTMLDKRVRPTHQEMEGETIPISEMFHVGRARMLFPRDVVNAAEFPEEIVNCRCLAIYF